MLNPALQAIDIMWGNLNLVEAQARDLLALSADLTRLASRLLELCADSRNHLLTVKDIVERFPPPPADEPSS